MLICLSLVLLCPMSRSKLQYKGTWVEDTRQRLEERINRFSDYDLEVLKRKRGIRTLQNRWFDPKLEERVFKIQHIKGLLQQKENYLNNSFKSGNKL